MLCDNNIAYGLAYKCLKYFFFVAVCLLFHFLFSKQYNAQYSLSSKYFFWTAFDMRRMFSLAHGCVLLFKPVWCIWSGALLWLCKFTTLHPLNKKSRFWPVSSPPPLCSFPLSSLADCCIVGLCSIMLAECIQACWHMQSSTARHPDKSTHTCAHSITHAYNSLD